MRKRKKKPKPPPVIPKKITVGKFYIEGKFGRIGMPSGPRRWSTSIMEREIKRLTAQIASGVSSDGGGVVTKDDKPGMLALAEASCTHKQICAILTKEALRALEGGLAVTRQDLIDHLTQFCDGQFWTAFHRKRTIEQVAARVFRRGGWYS